MYLSKLKIRGHPILGNIELDLINPRSKEAYSIIAFVGENGCGKTTILNELFNYEKSDYIIDKQTPYSIIPKSFDALYLRQGSLHRNAMKEIRKLIDNHDMYQVNSALYEDKNPFGMRMNNSVNRVKDGTKLLEKLGDDAITNIFKQNHIDEVWCSDEVSKSIDGMEHGYSINNFSSGQQEVLLKIKDIRKMTCGTDCVLIDEPETSLHPRWQKEIINLLSLMLSDVEGNVPQIFLATHSEKVLESLIKRDDVLIVRLSREERKIKTETINEMDLRLPTPTFGELDYLVFHIPSFEYHDELFNRFAYQIRKNSTIAVDEKIQKIINKIYKHDVTKFEKTRVYTVYNKTQTTNTIPTYIRDFFHHPNEIQPPTQEELVMSIELLRELVKYMDERIAKMMEEEK